MKTDSWSFSYPQTLKCGICLPWVPEVGWSWIMPLPPSRLKLTPRWPVGNLGISHLRALLNSGGSMRISWQSSYLELLQWVRGILSLRRKYEEKMFPESSYPFPQTCPPYQLWCVVEVCTQVRSRALPGRKFPRYISPRFLLSWKLSAPTSPHDISETHVWTHRPQ